MKVEWLVIAAFGYLVYRAAHSQAAPAQPPASDYSQYTTEASCKAAGGSWMTPTAGGNVPMTGKCYPPNTIIAI